MGKKSGKGKEKKLRRKEEQAKITAAQSLVNAANTVDDLMKPLAPFTKYDRNGLRVSIGCKRLSELSNEEFNWAFDLTKANMQTIYDSTSWGWCDKKKREEMSEESAWYLIAKDESGKAVGLSHFRFDLDNDIEVLYCYEIQLDKSVRNKGLGKFLMQILQLLAHRSPYPNMWGNVARAKKAHKTRADDEWFFVLFLTRATLTSAWIRPSKQLETIKYSMQKVMVTVFKDNEKAMAFFTKLLKFQNDETSPRYYDPLHPEDYCYEILSKLINKPAS